MNGERKQSWIWIGGTTAVLVAAGVAAVGLSLRQTRQGREARGPAVVPVSLPLPAATPAPLLDRAGIEPAVVSPGAVGPETIDPLPLEPGRTHAARGEELYQAGDFGSAARYLEADLQARGDRYHPTYLLGLALWKSGDRDGAVVRLQDAARIDPSAVKAHLNLARVLNDAGRFEEALAAVETAAGLRPDDPAVRNVRGRTLLNLGRRDEAMVDFRRAIELDPGEAWALNNLGYALIGAGRDSEAVEPLERAVALDPANSTFHNNLGMAYERTGRRSMAVEEYRHAAGGGSQTAVRNLARLDGGPLTTGDPAREPAPDSGADEGTEPPAGS